MRIAVVTMLCLAPAMAGAQQVAIRSNNDPVVALSQDQLARLSPVEKEVLAADNEWARAYHACDMAAMDKVMDDSILFIHAHARVDTKPLLMKQFGSCGNEETVTKPIRVAVITPDTAIVEAAMSLKQKGVADPIRSLYTRVYAKKGGAWRMVANQTTRNTYEEGK